MSVFQTESIFSSDNPALKFLKALVDEGKLLSIDYHFAGFIANEASNSLNSEDINLVALLSAKLSNQISSQNTCLQLSDFNPNHAFGVSLPEDVKLPSKESWLSILLNNDLAVEFEINNPQNATLAPFVVSGDYLYLHKYFQYDLDIAQRIKHSNFPIGHWSYQIDEVQIDEALSTLFDGDTSIDRQYQAVKHSLLAKFSIITGGPGTGKTTTVVKLLAAQQMLRKKQGLPPLKQMLLAPTGKAAQRLTESIINSKQSLELDEDILACVPSVSSTLHRAISKVSNQSLGLTHDVLLDADVILVDEASMVDVGLMAKLISVVPSDAQILLLGDQYQLASVEAGNLLADLANVPQQSYITQLTKSYRFDDSSEIGLLAKAINSGSTDTALNILRQANHQLTWLEPSESSLSASIDAMASHYIALRKMHREHDEEQNILLLLKEMQKLQMLCCTRTGSFSVEHVNALVEERLSQRLHVRLTSHYHFRPIMIKENAYHLSLFNGDVGIEVYNSKTDKIFAYFRDENNALRRVNTQRLPEHETVYAMTVHKSQGSEFDSVVMLLPNNSSKLLSREILYTGLTRSKSSFTLIGHESTVKIAISNKASRSSGLAHVISKVAY
jgi:exodeoxyribonuclease V alpha subunit